MDGLRAKSYPDGSRGRYAWRPANRRGQPALRSPHYEYDEVIRMVMLSIRMNDDDTTDDAYDADADVVADAANEDDAADDADDCGGDCDGHAVFAAHWGLTRPRHGLALSRATADQLALVHSALARVAAQ